MRFTRVLEGCAELFGCPGGVRKCFFGPGFTILTPNPRTLARPLDQASQCGTQASQLQACLTRLVRQILEAWPSPLWVSNPSPKTTNSSSETLNPSLQTSNPSPGSVKPSQKSVEPSSQTVPEGYLRKFSHLGNNDNVGQSGSNLDQSRTYLLGRRRRPMAARSAACRRRRQGGVGWGGVGGEVAGWGFGTL